MRVCRVGTGGELCQMLFGNLEGWRRSVFYDRYCVQDLTGGNHQIDQVCKCQQTNPARQVVL